MRFNNKVDFLAPAVVVVAMASVSYRAAGLILIGAGVTYAVALGIRFINRKPQSP